MPTAYGRGRDHYVNAATRARINGLIKEEGMSHADVAYEMRMTRSHVSAMFGGSKPMAHHHLLAIKFILLKRRSENQQRERDSLTPSREI